MMALATGLSPTCQLAMSAQADANPPNAGTTPIEGCSSGRPLSEGPRALKSILSEWPLIRVQSPPLPIGPGIIDSLKLHKWATEEI